MATELATLLAPVAGEVPCGPDLSYDPERLEIEKVFDQPFSIDAAGMQPVGGDTDWEGLIARIVQQFARTKDIWLAVYLCRAGARAGSLATVEIGTETLAGLLSQYWEDVHPRIDEAGIAGRKTPCDSLGRESTLLNPLGRVRLLAHPRLGVFTISDFQKMRKGAGQPEQATLAELLAELGDGPLREADSRLLRIIAALRAAEKTFADRSGGQETPEFAPTCAFLEEARKGIAGYIKPPASGNGTPSEGQADEIAGVLNFGVLRTREDVMRTLDNVCDYYRRAEPSSPVPLLIERAKTWVSSPFLDVLADIAPAGMPEAKRVLTREKKP